MKYSVPMSVLAFGAALGAVPYILGAPIVANLAVMALKAISIITASTLRLVHM